ncbi:MAG: PAS domain-containing protein [Phormidium sp. BM_Day4_Bin.17]|nr:PAS domain-containing protein [Phormidium sp. BM_Day4_Bin.17]UCJ13681.1 MAG: PAS domain-containing protein [Phormidium sp. PBR-2020]
MSCSINAQTNSENQPFQTLFNIIGEGLILLDHQGYCQQINPAACQILGQSATTLSQRHLNDFKQLGLEGIPPWKNPPNPEPQSGQFRLRRADGKTYQIDYIISPNVTPAHHILNWRFKYISKSEADRYIDKKKQSENALWQKEIHLALALQGSQTGTWDWNIQTQETVLDEKQWKAFLGSCDEPEVSRLITQPLSEWQDRIHPEDKDQVNQAILAHLAGETELFSHEYRVRCQDNSYKWMLSQGKVVAWDEAGQPHHFIGIYQDVSQRKANEIALTELSQQLKKAQEVAHLGYWSLDLDSEKITWSEQVFHIFNHPIEQGEPSFEEHIQQIYPDDRPLVLERVARATEGIPQRFDYRIMHPGGTIRHLNARIELDVEDERVVRLFGTLLDITERVEVEQALRENDEKLQSLFDLSPLGISLNDMQGQFIEANPAITEITGYSLEEIQTLSYWDLTPAQYADDETRQLELLNSIGRYGPYEKEYIHKQGYRVPIELNGMLITGRDGQHYIWSMIADISDRKQAEAIKVEQVNRELKLLENILEVVLGGYWDLDILNNQEYLSPGLKRMLGYEDHELPNSPESWQRLIFSEDLTRVFQQFDDHIQSRGTIPFYNEVRYHHKDGSTVWVLCSGRVIEWDDQDNPLRMIGCHIDISDRKQAETALKDSQIRLKLALESSNIGLWDWHLDSNIVTFNGNWGTMLGYEKHEISNNFHEWESRVHPQDLEGAYADIKRHLQGESNVYQNEHRLRCKDGSYKWILAKGRVVQWDEAGNPLRFIGTHNDIDARKQAELTLITLNQQFKKAQEVANLGYWSFDLASEKITWSEEVFKIFGITPDQGEPTYAEHLKQYHPEDLPQVLEHIEAAYRGIPQQYDFRLVHPTGKIRYATSHVEVEVRNGKTIRLFGTVMNITKRKQNEAIIQQALSAADAANRAKSQFLANMSHELRTPLNAILGFTDMMSHDPEIPREQQEYLKIIHQSGEHLLQIINDILEISKIEAGKVDLNPAPFNLAQLLQSLEYLFRKKIDQKGINFTIISDPGLPKFIKTDELKLRQTLINLINNAIKFTPKGEVIVQIRPKDLQGQTSPDSSSGSFSIEFTIADTGPGIAPEELSKLFEAFSQTETGKASKQGTGLGLAISRKFIQMMGGDIHVSSTLGVGTVFTFDIQAQPVQFKTISVSPPPPRIIHLSPETEPPRILIVDDIEESRLLLRTLLGNIGFHIEEARQGEEALNLWETWQPQLILMDLQMPVLDGYEATRQLRQRESTNRSGTSSPPRRTPIIALTANLFAEEQQAATFAGCDRLIAKPFSEQELLKTIGTYLNLQYLYENKIVYDRGECAKTSFGESPLEGLAQMPKSWLMELQQYTKLGSDDLIFSLIARSLREDCPAEQSLAEHILQLTRNFQFARLNELIDECLKS